VLHTRALSLPSQAPLTSRQRNTSGEDVLVTSKKEGRKEKNLKTRILIVAQHDIGRKMISRNRKSTHGGRRVATLRKNIINIGEKEAVRCRNKRQRKCRASREEASLKRLIDKYDCRASKKRHKQK